MPRNRPRPFRSIPVLAALAALNLSAAWSASADPAPSTGQIEHAVEPLPPFPTPTALTLPAGQPTLLEEGKVSAAHPAQYVIQLPANARLEIRTSSPQGLVRQAIFLGDKTASVPGCGEADGCIGWISNSEEGGPLRIGLRTTATGDVPYRLGIKVEVTPPAEPKEKG